MKKIHLHQLIAEWMGPRAILEALEKKISLFPLPGIETIYLGLYGSHRAV